MRPGKLIEIELRAGGAVCVRGSKPEQRVGQGASARTQMRKEPGNGQFECLRCRHQKLLGNGCHEFSEQHSLVRMKFKLDFNPFKACRSERGVKKPYMRCQSTSNCAVKDLTKMTDKSMDETDYFLFGFRNMSSKINIQT